MSEEKRDARRARWRARIKAARAVVQRPLDDDDREALTFLIETAKDARADGKISLEEIEALGEAIAEWRQARKETP